MTQRLLWWIPALALCAVFASLGLWQKGRGEQKEAFLADFERALQAAPHPLHEALTERKPLPLPVAGRLERVDGAPWLMLDNARRGDAVGLRAHALYRDADSGAVVLVDFGWLPFDAGRRLPAIDAPPDVLDARGLLVTMPGQGLRLGAPPALGPGESPVLLTTLDLAEIGAAFALTLFDGMLRLDPALPLGFARDLDALPNTLPPEKHYGYALQWFGFAAALFVIALILTFRKPRP